MTVQANRDAVTTMEAEIRHQLDLLVEITGRVRGPVQEIAAQLAPG